MRKVCTELDKPYHSGFVSNNDLDDMEAAIAAEKPGEALVIYNRLMTELQDAGAVKQTVSVVL